MKTVIAFVSVLFLAFLDISCGAPKPDVAKATTQDPDSSTSPLWEFAMAQEGDYYYGIYFSGMKVGWRALRISVDEDVDTGALVYDDETLFIISLNGQVLKNTSRSRCTYTLTAPGYITSCAKEEVSNNDFSSTTVTLEGAKHATTINYNGRTKEYLSSLSKDTIEMAKALDDWILGERRPGDTFDLFGLDVDGLRSGRASLDSKSRVTYSGKKKVRWRGERVVVVEIENLDESGVHTHFEVLQNGVTRSIQVGPLEFRLEDENTVMDFKTSKLDVAQTIPSNVFMGNPKEIESLELLLKMRERFSVPETRRQRVVRKRNHSVLLELLPEHLVAEGEPLTEAQKEKYTSATLLIPSDHADIKKLGSAIVGDEKDPIRMADLLQSWVYLNIRKTYGSDTGSALKVLENRSGDCTELSLLFTALARSVGLPARELTGLVYDDLNNVFGWHEWAEIHNGHQWISVDPTWNELFVNATHIRLSKDDEDLGSIALLNQVEIEVKSFKKK